MFQMLGLFVRLTWTFLDPQDMQKTFQEKLEEVPAPRRRAVRTGRRAIEGHHAKRAGSPETSEPRQVWHPV